MDSETPQQLGYGLLRFRSAPGSLLDGKGSPTTESLEEDKFRSRFMGFSSSDVLEEKPRSSPTANSPRGYPGLPPQYPRVSSGLSSSSAMDGSYLGVGSLGMDHQNQPKLNSSNLSRQNSTPPGLFSQLSAQNGYAAVKGSGNHRVGSGFEGDLSPTSRLKGQFNFQASVGMLSQISEIGGESMGDGVPEDSIRIGIGGNVSRCLGSGFQFNSWNNTPHFSDNLAGLKRERDDDMRLFPDSQNCELGNRGTILSHHLSLPRSSSEFSTVEKFLQFQDSVPCKIRAKRGCATHPRSIAERVRRTRISERMRKLQELVPNMDKQTNTADMLDLAVDYIKDLQSQFKTLNDVRANCRCLNQQKSMANPMI